MSELKKSKCSFFRKYDEIKEIGDPKVVAKAGSKRGSESEEAKKKSDAFDRINRQFKDLVDDTIMVSRLFDISYERGDAVEYLIKSNVLDTHKEYNKFVSKIFGDEDGSSKEFNSDSTIANAVPGFTFDDYIYKAKRIFNYLRGELLTLFDVLTKEQINSEDQLRNIFHNRYWKNVEKLHDIIKETI